MATAGHVDHGKSTLVHALTGMATDRLRSERERGLTQDLGFAWFRGPPDVALVDVPGHEKYLSTTLAGLGPSPAALFVVAADQGWQEQSSEHLAALTGLGTTGDRLVLAITRTDLAPTADLRRLLAEADARVSAAIGRPRAVVPVSIPRGQGVHEVRAALQSMATRPHSAASSGVIRSPTPRTARLWVDRVFTVRGTGTVVSGTLLDGILALPSSGRLDVRLVGVRPGGSVDRTVSVRALQSLGRRVTTLAAPARVAVALRGLDVEGVRRGDLLTVDPADRGSSRWRVHRLDIDPGSAAATRPSVAIGPGLQAQVQAHVGTATTPGRLTSTARGARLILRDPIAARPGDHVALRSIATGRLTGAVRLLVREDRTPHPPSRETTTVGDRDLALLRPILNRLSDHPFDAPAAPVVRALPGHADLLTRAEAAGLLLRLTSDVLVHADAQRLALELLTDLPQPFRVSEARRRLRTSRRVVMPLLSLLARRGLTQRVDDQRHAVRSGQNPALDFAKAPPNPPR